MQLIRAFFAINLPQIMQDNIRLVIDPIKLPIRWTKPNHLHITLQFLKEVRLDDTMRLIENVSQKIQTIRPFEIEFNHLEFFPDVNHPRFLSLIPSPNDTLILLTKRIGEGILATNYPIETRSFRPHLTLGKLHDIPSEKKSFDIASLHEKKFLVNNILFYQSNPQKQGSCYTTLETISLHKFEY